MLNYYNKTHATRAPCKLHHEIACNYAQVIVI
nr:MAG TPA: hypothetical protein [Caudoviricetes sp.]